MDFATPIGLVSGTIIIVLAILSGSNIATFIDIPGLLIVLGGTFVATLIKFTIGICISPFGLALKKAFWQEPERARDIIQQPSKLASLARKEKLLALEQEPISNPFFKKCIQLCLDGHKPGYIRDALTRDRKAPSWSPDILMTVPSPRPIFDRIGNCPLPARLPWPSFSWMALVWTGRALL